MSASTQSLQRHAIDNLLFAIRAEIHQHIDEGDIPGNWSEKELTWLLGEVFWNNYLGRAPIGPRDERHLAFKRYYFNKLEKR